MNNVDDLALGVVGTTLSAIGAGLSINEIQAIISIVVTVFGFIFSVLIPLICKLIKKIKKAREDGEITQEEVEGILETGKEIAEETGSFINQQLEESKDKDND